MNKEEFSRVRIQLGKTQPQIAQLVGCSVKAIQSFEQGIRKVPVHVERLLLFLLAGLNSHGKKKISPCWEVRDCSLDARRSCPAWEFQMGNYCWFINGTICHGEIQESWGEKITLCRQCNVFRSLLPSLYE